MDVTILFTTIITDLARLLAESRRENGRITALDAGALINEIYGIPGRQREIEPVPKSIDDVPLYTRKGIRESLRDGAGVSEDIIDDVMREAVAAAHHLYQIVAIFERQK